MPFSLTLTLDCFVHTHPCTIPFYVDLQTHVCLHQTSFERQPQRNQKITLLTLKKRQNWTPLAQDAPKKLNHTMVSEGLDRHVGSHKFVTGLTLHSFTRHLRSLTPHRRIIHNLDSSTGQVLQPSLRWITVSHPNGEVLVGHNSHMTESIPT